MINMRSLLPFLFSAVFCISLSAQDVLEYTIQQVSGSITIDGNLDEADWSAASPTENYVILGDDETTPATTSWSKMLWDDDYLYVAFYCEDFDIWATYDNRDDQLYQEDAIEIYIDPDGDGLNYLEIEVNPLNAIFDLWLTKPWSDGGQGHSEWNMSGILTAVTLDGTNENNSDTDVAWTCEVALPFSEMEFSAEEMNYPPEINDEWRFNLYRFDRESTNDPDGEATGWSQTEGGQHEPDYFGKITFNAEPESIDPILITMGGIRLDQNYPNPARDNTTISYMAAENETLSFHLLDISGREIHTRVLEPAGQKIVLSTSGFASGSYLYFIQSGKLRSEVRKMHISR